MWRRVSPGDRVFIDIDSQRETQRIVSTVSGPLGEWFSLGGRSRSRRARQPRHRFGERFTHFARRGASG